ncbi:MAG: hypothetical protein IIU29_02950 [Erysipelotrichaceae bacterium]|nr:hypothetical protein [Erysipelotrichaceae bacterium]
MIKKILLILIDLLCVFVCLFFSISAYVRYREDYIRIPIASHQLYQRTQIKEEDLIMTDVPRAYLSEDVCTDKKEILGKYVKLSYSLAKGSLIYKGALEEGMRDLSLTLLKEGEVSYDLYASEVKVNTGILSPNLSVDVYLNIKTNDKTLSDLLLSHCRVVGLYDMKGRPIREYQTDQRIMIVSIAVEKSHVAILNKALMAGSLSVFAGEESYDSEKRAKLNEEAEVLMYLQ